MSKQKLIEEIWNYCKHSHSNKDYKDLNTFDVEELEEILSDCKESNY